MRWFWIIVLLLLSCLAEVTLAHSIGLNGVRPDLAFIVALFVCLHVPLEKALAFAWLAGLAKDFCSISPAGVNALLFALCAYLLWTLRKRLFREHPITQLIMVLVTVTTYNMAYVVGLFLCFPSFVPYTKAAVFRFLDSVLYTSLLAPVCFFVFRRLKLHINRRALFAETFARKR